MGYYGRKRRMNPAEFGSQVAQLVKEYVGQKLGPIERRLTAVETASGALLRRLDEAEAAGMTPERIANLADDAAELRRIMGNDK
jgi:hypothetical protein